MSINSKKATVKEKEITEKYTLIRKG